MVNNPLDAKNPWRSGDDHPREVAPSAGGKGVDCEDGRDQLRWV